MDALAGLGLRLVIVSNNSAGLVREFLENHGLRSRFEAVVGRDPQELRHMKPDPYSVHRALEILRLPAAEALLIGDQLTDLQTARAAGTALLGHTPSAERARQMRSRGADAVVHTHAPVIEAARSLAAAGVNQPPDNWAPGSTGRLRRAVGVRVRPSGHHPLAPDGAHGGYVWHLALRATNGPSRLERAQGQPAPGPARPGHRRLDALVSRHPRAPALPGLGPALAEQHPQGPLHGVPGDPER